MCFDSVESQILNKAASTPEGGREGIMPKKAKKGGGGKMGRDESQTEEEMAKKKEEILAQCLRVSRYQVVNKFFTVKEQR